MRGSAVCEFDDFATNRKARGSGPISPEPKTSRPFSRKGGSHFLMAPVILGTTSVHLVCMSALVSLSMHSTPPPRRLSSMYCVLSGVKVTFRSAGKEGGWVSRGDIGGSVRQYRVRTVSGRQLSERGHEWRGKRGGEERERAIQEEGFAAVRQAKDGRDGVMAWAEGQATIRTKIPPASPP